MKTTRSSSLQYFYHPDNGGFTLIEVLVSLVVLAIGLLGLAMLQTTGMRFNTNSYSRTQATYLAYDIAERIRANIPAFLNGNYDVLNKTAADNIVASSDYTCNQVASPTGCTCDTGTCDNATMAKYDLGQWYYRLDTLLPGAKDAAGLASSPERATISHNGDTATITIYWLEQDRNGKIHTNPIPTSQTWQLEIYQ